jgi:hypothetical protein
MDGKEEVGKNRKGRNRERSKEPADTGSGLNSRGKEMMTFGDADPVGRRHETSR